MDMKPSNKSEKPVAYDANGRPLYAHPQKKSARLQAVHVVKSAKPMREELSPEIKLKHERSKSDFPNINLSDGEYVILDVKRHPIGLVPPFAIAGILLILSYVFAQNYRAILQNAPINLSLNSEIWVIFAIIGFVSLVLLGLYVAYYVYTRNRFILTNESVIQHLQTGLFYSTEQTVSLSNIEDASFTQKGIMEHLFNYGSIRLSTEGDETTYRFSYVANPKKHIAILNNAVESFKNGHPFGSED